MISGNEVGSLRALLVVILIVLVGQRAPSALADVATPQAWGLPQLMHDFSLVKAARAHFVEQKYLRMLKKPLQGNGILVYEAPARLQKETLQPKSERLLIDGDTLTIEREGKTQTMSRSDYPQIWAFIEGIRATLAGDRAALKSVYTIHLDGDPTDWHLLLEPRDPQMQEIVQSIRIAGSDAHIKHIETRERDGDRTDMTIAEDGR